MTISDLKQFLDEMIDRYGDVEIGNPHTVGLLLDQVGWIAGWSQRAVNRGIQWEGGDVGRRFVGTSVIRRRTGGDRLYRPTEEELGPPEIVETKP